MPFSLTRSLAIAALLLAAPFATLAQNVGIGTTAPTQKLDVDGQLRVRGLSAPGEGRLLRVAPDGTLQATAPLTGGTPQFPVSQGTVPAGSSPFAVALNPAGTRAFVANYNSNTLQVYDVSGPGLPSSLGTVPTGSSPIAVALNPAGTRAFVANYDSNTLQVYDVSGPGLPASLGTVPTDAGPNAVALNPAGTRAFVVNFNSNTLQVFDVSGPGLPSSLGTVPAGSLPIAVALNPAGTRAFVVNFNSNTLQAFDVSGAGLPVSQGTVPTGNRPYAVALNPAGTRAFVVNNNSNTLQVYDVSGPGLPSSLGTVPTGIFPIAVALNPAGTRAFVVNSNNTLQLYDVSSVGLPASLGTLPTGSSPNAVALNPTGTRAFVVNNGSGTLEVFAVGSPRLVAVGPDGSLGSLDPATLADNLGNHTATRNLDLGPNQLVGNGGSTGLAISSTGRVGIGTPAPAAPLDVQAGTPLTGTTTGTDTQLRLTRPGTSGSKWPASAELAVGTYATGVNAQSQLDFRLGQNNNAVADQTVLTLRGDGRVGIGTSTPRGVLDVGNGNSYLVANPNSGSTQDVYLPGHLFLAPYSGTSGTAYVQARVPSPTTTTNIGLTLRTTNAGNLVDALSLAANGNLSTTGQVSTQGNVTVPAANAYAYAAPKTYTYTVGAADFNPEFNGTTYTIHRNGDTDELFAAYGGVSETAYRAPLHLPQGALITRLVINYSDSETTYDLTASLRALSLAAPQAVQRLIAGITPGGAPGHTTASATVSEVVDNANNHYFLRVVFPVGTSALTISAMRVTYTVTQAE